MSSAARKVRLHYSGPSEVVADAASSKVRLALDDSRGPVGVRGAVKAPSFFRDALLTAIDVLGSDLRYKKKDRAQYLAYLAKQGKKATKEIWEAQKAYIDEQLDGEEKPKSVLEPLFTVHPDEVSLEVFSRDESSYARLALKNELFDAREAAHGTTCVDLSSGFVERLERMRGWRPVDFEATSTAKGQERGESVDVPWGWLRGLLQVQSAATLPAAKLTLAPIDLYNLLFVLRTRKAKTSPRGLRFELVPGARPRIIVEPWELVIESHGPVYDGKAPRVVRTFGRQRLLTLARALPYVSNVQVHLLGAGLPNFWVLDFGAQKGHLTVGFTGWTESGWSSAAAFDALMPPLAAQPAGDRVHSLLGKSGPRSFEQLQSDLGLSPTDARAATQVECLRGRVVYDVKTRTFRPRALLDAPVDLSAIRFGTEREAQAHRLLDTDGKVSLTKVHEIIGEGTELVGEVIDQVARRSYSPSFTLDPEGRVSGASCQCPTYRRAGMREGPCEHMIALRLFHARKKAADEANRLTPEGRKLIRAETRTLVRREGVGTETVYRVSLDAKAVVVKWGPRSTEGRQQRLWFDSDEAARDAYFARLDSLGEQGFIDAEA